MKGNLSRHRKYINNVARIKGDVGGEEKKERGRERKLRKRKRRRGLEEKGKGIEGWRRKEKE